MHKNELVHFLERLDQGLPWYMGKPKTALSRFGETPQGTLVLHHALPAYPKWEEWGEDHRPYGPQR